MPQGSPYKFINRILILLAFFRNEMLNKYYFILESRYEDNFNGLIFLKKAGERAEIY